MRLGKLITLKLVTKYSSHTRSVVTDTPVEVGQRVLYKGKIYIVMSISYNDYIM